MAKQQVDGQHCGRSHLLGALANGPSNILRILVRELSLKSREANKIEQLRGNYCGKVSPKQLHKLLSLTTDRDDYARQFF